MRELSVSDLRGSRLHLFGIQLLFTIVVVGLVVLELGLSPETWNRASLGSSEYFTDGFRWAAVGLVPLVWFVPIGALVFMVPVAWLLPLGEYQFVAGWRCLAIGCVAAIIWVVLRSRSGRPHGPRQKPLVKCRFEESWAHQRSTLGWLALSGGLVLAAGLLISHAVLIGEASAFESRAERVAAEVVSYDDEIYEMVLSVDGEEITVDEPEWWDPPAVGDTIVVLVDPDDPLIATLPESLKDPAWLVGLAVLSPLAGLALGWPILRRSYGRRRLMRHGAPGRIARLEWANDSGFSLQATDGRVPILEVHHLAGVVPEVRVTAFLDQWFDHSRNPDEAAAPVPSPRSWSRSAWVRAILDDIKNGWRHSDWNDRAPSFDRMLLNEKTEAEPWLGPDVGDGEPFVLLGPWSHGSTVALVRNSDRVWLAEIKEPRFTTGSRPVLPGEAERGLSGRSTARRALPASLGRARTGFDRLGATFWAWVYRNSRWLRWLVPMVVAVPSALLVGLLLWVAIDEHEGHLSRIMATAAGITAFAAPMFASDWVGFAATGRARKGLVSHGFPLDEIVANDRLVSVKAHQSVVAVRLQDPQDELMILTEDVGEDLEPEEAAAQVRLWFDAASANGRSHRRPSPVLLAGVLQIVLSAVFTLWFVA